MVYRYNTNRLDVEFRKARQIVNDTDPSLGGNLDLNGFAFVAQLQAAESLAVEDLCYLNSSGKMAKADADAVSSSSTLLTLSTEALNTNDVGTFVLNGFYTTTGLSPGDILYADTVAGSYTPSFPRGSGDVVRIIGYAITSTQLYFNPDKTWIELA